MGNVGGACSSLFGVKWKFIGEAGKLFSTRIPRVRSVEILLGRFKAWTMNKWVRKKWRYVGEGSVRGLANIHCNVLFDSCSYSLSVRTDRNTSRNTIFVEESSLHLSVCSTFLNKTTKNRLDKINCSSPFRAIGFLFGVQTPEETRRRSSPWSSDVRDTLRTFLSPSIVSFLPNSPRRIHEKPPNRVLSNDENNRQRFITWIPSFDYWTRVGVPLFRRILRGCEIILVTLQPSTTIERSFELSDFQVNFQIIFRSIQSANLRSFLFSYPDVSYLSIPVQCSIININESPEWTRAVSEIAYNTILV